MNDAQLVQVLDAANYLLEELTGLGLLELLLFDDVIEQLATTNVLHDKEQLLGRLDNLKELDDVGMSNHLEDIDFPRHSQDVCVLDDFALLQDLDGHLHSQTDSDSPFLRLICAFRA